MMTGCRSGTIATALICLLCLWSVPAPALDSTLDASQYGHASWKYRDGFAKRYILALAQTRDGYLWLGTAFGLWRFDGVRSVPWQPPARTSLPDSRIRALLAARDGTLWIGTWAGLASWDGRRLINYPRFSAIAINSVVQDREGTVWVGGQSSTTGLLCAIRGGIPQCIGEDNRFGATASAYVDHNEGLWVAGTNNVWRWKPGSPKRYSLPEPLSGSLETLSETSPGNIMVATRTGLQQLIDRKFEPFPLPQLLENTEFHGVLRDRDGALWIGTNNRGLLHFHHGRFDIFDQSDGLSDERVTKLFEDHEGNMWVATLDGLDCFRALPVTTYSRRQGVSGVPGSVLAAKDGSIWFASTAGLYRGQDGRMFAYSRQSRHPDSSPIPAATDGEIAILSLPENPWGSLFQDRLGRIWLGSLSGLGYLQNDRFIAVQKVPQGYIDSITEDGYGNIWVAHRDAGLLRVSPDLKVQTAPLMIGTKTGDAWRLAPDPLHGGLWIGLFSGGVAHLAGGRVREFYSVAGGLGKGIVNDLRVTVDGTVWAATDGGLSRIKAGRVATLNGTSGLPCDPVHSSVVDDDGSIWIYTACGLVRITRPDLEGWTSAIDRGRAPRTIKTTVLDDSDGVAGFPTPFPSTSPHLTKARDGKLWFVETDGVSTVDPHRLHFNAFPPPVHVEQLVGDHQTYDASSAVQLPPLLRDLEIDYTALSFVAPEKTRFRYRLDGHDNDWQDAGNRRQAFYTNLEPGDYRFRVIASNNSGIWNTDGAVLPFSIAPAYWQTNWFRALCAAAIVALLWAAYQMRVRQLAREATLAQKAEERHREMRLELAHANRVATMGQLTASIAHEVNQPIAATITNARAALRWLDREPPDLAEAREALADIVKNGNRADEVVSRVKAHVKKAPPQKERLDINDVIRDVIALTRSEAARNSVSVRTDLADVPLIDADCVQLQQVLLNLIINAIQAMGGMNEAARQLLIDTAKDESGGVLVTVKDTGPGLTPSQIDRLFAAFYTTKPDGLGLGLSICRSIVEAHGGRLWASANAPRGAAFQFTLPPPEYGS